MAPPKRLLVTGGAGFIGSHFVESRLAAGDRVTVLDAFDGFLYSSDLKRENAALLQRHSKAEALAIIEGDIRDDALLATVVPGHDTIVHLAGIAGVRPSLRDPAFYCDVNVTGTAKLLVAARAAGIDRFVFASSSSVYGNPPHLPADEEVALVPQSPYAATKRSGELLLEAWANTHPAARLASLRFFTVYGPRQRPDMAIRTFASKLLQDAPIDLFGDGSMRRDYTFVSDIVRGIEATVRNLDDRCGHRAFNLGRGETVDLRTLVAALEAVTGRTARVNVAPKPAGDVDATYASIARARDELGWVPEVSLADGLRAVVASLG
jgi:UDP-glucuronate 4-epimerase